MEPTNELITKAEANAEGFSIGSTNECMTKAEKVILKTIIHNGFFLMNI